MVRFRVIKGSHLLLALALIALAVVVCLLAAHYYFRAEPMRPTGSQASFVDAEPTGGEELLPASLAIPLEPEALRSGPAASPKAGLSIEVLRDEEDAGARARILIYHTHTHEAYQQEQGDPYAALELWRTDDNAHNVVRVGEELARLLRERGFSVVHDTTDNERDELSTAYTRSLETIGKYDEPFDLYIDLHRDAYAESTGAVAVSAGSRRLARLMVLIGRGDGFDVKPYYRENLAFAEALTEQLNRLQTGICRDVMVKKNRYNQHVGFPSILIEVGSNYNTLSEALASMPVLAEGLDYTLRTSPQTAPVQLATEGK